MHTATFTVPLTARVLRAILSDMEGTDALLGGCGCRADGVPTPVETTEEQQIEAKRRYMAEFAEQAPLTSGIAEQGNPFITGGVVEATQAELEAEVNAFMTTKGPVDLSNTVAPTIVEITPPSAPFILTPEGVVPVASVTDPFIGQASTVPAPPMPPATVTPPVPTAPVSAVPLDSEGLPWDKRIHASTRTKRIGDDTWKLMKGVDKDLVERVKAELRATMSAGTVATPPVVPAPLKDPTLTGSYSAATGHVVGVPTPPQPRNYSGAQSGGYTPQPPVQEAVIVPPAPPVTLQSPTVPGAPATFSDFVTYATNKIVGKQFSKAQLQEACANEGITSMPMLENRPDLIPTIWKFLESISIPASSVGGA